MTFPVIYNVRHIDGGWTMSVVVNDQRDEDDFRAILAAGGWELLDV